MYSSTQPGIFSGAPSKTGQGRAPKAEPRALGVGTKETGKGSPSPTPQHLPPFLTPPHWPGCESKTNWGPGLPQGLSRGSEGPQRKRDKETETESQSESSRDLTETHGGGETRKDSEMKRQREKKEKGYAETHRDRGRHPLPRHRHRIG